MHNKTKRVIENDQQQNKHTVRVKYSFPKYYIDFSVAIFEPKILFLVSASFYLYKTKCGLQTHSISKFGLYNCV